MISLRDLAPAIEKLYDAAMLGEGWAGALDSIARAGGASGVVLMHNRNRKLVAAVANNEIKEAVGQYLVGDAPKNSRQLRVSHDIGSGFRIDQDDYRPEEIARDPYYQEFLRPIGFGWHANARISMEDSDEIAIGFKRDLKRGPYEDSDKQTLNLILPHIRSAARVTQYVFEAETRGLVRGLLGRGNPVLEFDSWGRVRREHGKFEKSSGPLQIALGRARTADPSEQRKFDEVVLRAANDRQMPGGILIHDRIGNRFIFQVLPVCGRARDVFHATTAVGLLIHQPRRHAISFNRDLAIQLFGLSAREAEVVGLICQGRSLREISSTLSVVPDTVRYHLKSVFEKTGTNRQIDLVALFAGLVG
ncbi:helix-turn-helix transcriptional regulator [Bradyrhizobium manausense]|uniref:helix-turn-helix transcriptional regulator n=1 Tax=Bradyrhizobium manausense TaxID=989370 RepID=UPI00201272EC|nr:helix-turn-helix transcriptional regulator [Bradyrhizobium manausense]